MSQLNRNGSSGLILTRESIQIAVQILHLQLVSAHITSMTGTWVAKQVAINNTMVQKTPKLPGGALLKGRGDQQSKATGSTETR